MLAVAPVESVKAEGKFTLQSTSNHSFSPEGSISISNVNGSISIEGWDKAEVQIEITKKAKFSEDIEGATVSKKVSNDSISLKSQLKTNRRGFLGLRRKSSTASISYRIHAPRTATIKRVKSVNGPIRVQQFDGVVKGSTVNGPAELSNLTGDIEVSTVNGAIKAQLSNDIQAPEIELDTVNGSIELQLPESTSARFRGKSINGDIRNDFGLDVKKKFPIGKQLSGKTGTGEAEIELSTVNGRIVIKKL